VPFGPGLVVFVLAVIVNFWNKWHDDDDDDDNKKAVLSQRLPRDAPTKVNKNKQLHLHLRSRDSRLTQFNRTLWT